MIGEGARQAESLSCALARSMIGLVAIDGQGLEEGSRFKHLLAWSSRCLYVGVDGGKGHLECGIVPAHDEQQRQLCLEGALFWPPIYSAVYLAAFELHHFLQPFVWFDAVLMVAGTLILVVQISLIVAQKLHLKSWQRTVKKERTRAQPAV